MTNLVITGFMGTGKTVVGQRVAHLLDRRFLDMDAEIETRAGKSIRTVFEEQGEAAFRDMEAALCRELSHREDEQVPSSEGLVIATGGGTLIDPANRALMMRTGTVVCLSSEADEVLRRLNEAEKRDRPLLAVVDPLAEIERLMESRREHYEAIPWQIDTAGRPIEDVAARVVQLARTRTLPVRSPGGGYEIHVGDGLLAHVGGAMRAAGIPSGSLVAVVSNDVVAPLYRAAVETSLRSAGFRRCVCKIPDGEEHKSLATVASLYDQFLAAGLDRSGTVLALGGGVTGDVAGYAAATYMRGVGLVQVPTSLLAMVDASVGGKTGVDLSQGKNLVGAFKQPELVLIDPAVLATLPDEEFRCGLAEIIKHGVIGDPELFAELEGSPGDTSSWRGAHATPRIVQALQVKIGIVENDPYESGRRAVLNLGHTVGHAIEKLSGFSLGHGQAVAVGMVAAARIAVETGLAEPSVADRVRAVLTKWGLPVRCPEQNAEAISEAMAHDKKRRGRRLRWVLPCRIGRVEIVDDVPTEVVKLVLEDLTERSST